MRNLLFALLLLPLMASCVKDTAQVTLDSLLDEMISVEAVSYTHLRAHETGRNLV